MRITIILPKSKDSDDYHNETNDENNSYDNFDLRSSET